VIVISVAIAWQKWPRDWQNWTDDLQQQANDLQHWPEGVSQPRTGIHFGMCGSPPHRDCVIDGDTFYVGRQSIRIADIDAPETRGANCAFEAELGRQATLRLRELLNLGPIVLETGWRDTDRYGRALRLVSRHGRSIGWQLVEEGLARPWTGRRRPWCTS
jgi:endonuclease YncB( thermonuclease family)